MLARIVSETERDNRVEDIGYFIRRAGCEQPVPAIVPIPIDVLPQVAWIVRGKP